MGMIFFIICIFCLCVLIFTKIAKYEVDVLEFRHEYDKYCEKKVDDDNVDFPYHGNAIHCSDI